MRYQLITIRTCPTEEQGSLAFFEANRDIPFSMERIYYIFDVPKGVRRGGHAHKNLRQLLFCPYGKILITLDDGKERQEILLDSPSKGLVVDKGIWRDMDWLQDSSVLCVAADHYYNADDYIRDYDEFKKYVEKGFWNHAD